MLRNFVLTGRCGIPVTALAVSANVTVTGTLGAGFILIRPRDGASVTVSTLNYVAGDTVANAAVIPLGTGGGGTFIAGAAGTHLIIDVNGYYAEAAPAGVTSLNTLTGDVSVAAGSNVSITPSGNTLTISATPGGGGGDITSVIAGTGLTGGGSIGDVTLSVNLVGSGVATTVSRSDHDHFGQAWSGDTLNGGSAALSLTNARIGARAVFGQATAATGFSDGVFGVTASAQGRGTVGYATATAGQNYGVWGQTDSGANGRGVYGLATTTNGNSFGVHGEATSPLGTGVYGRGGRGVSGFSDGDFGEGVLAFLQSTSSPGAGVHGETNSPVGTGVLGLATNSSGTNYGIYGLTSSSAGYAGYFQGRVNVTGVLSKGGGAFKIDHPLDPENKYLYHSFVESPDMKNIYDGVVSTDTNGFATVELPDWFEALNRDFRYQLTVIDGGDLWVLAKVAREIGNNQFTIRTSIAGVKVSWQVTGIRKDPFAEKHRIPVEQDKPADERGTFLHPEAWGRPAEAGLDFKHRASLPKRD